MSATPSPRHAHPLHGGSGLRRCDVLHLRNEVSAVDAAHDQPAHISRHPVALRNTTGLNMGDVQDITDHAREPICLLLDFSKEVTLGLGKALHIGLTERANKAFTERCGSA